MKKCLSIILAIVLVFSAFGGTAPYVFAENGQARGDVLPDAGQIIKLAEGMKTRFIVPVGEENAIWVSFTASRDGKYEFSPRAGDGYSEGARFFDSEMNVLSEEFLYYECSMKAGQTIYAKFWSNEPVPFISGLFAIYSEDEKDGIGGKGGFNPSTVNSFIETTPGATVNVAVDVDPSYVSYQWYIEKDMYLYDGLLTEKLEGETGPTLTVTDSLSRRYLCQVTDDKGRKGCADAWVEVNNGLTVSAQNATQQDWRYYVVADSNGNAELEVAASASSGSTDLRYRWYKNVYRDGLIPYNDPLTSNDDKNTLSVSVTDTPTEYACYVFDEYDNLINVDFIVYPYYYAAAQSDHLSEVTVQCQYNMDTDLFVEAYSGDGLVNYKWYKDGTAIDGKSGQSDSRTQPITITIDPVTNNADYTCKVTDVNGAEKEVVFHVKMQLMYLTGNTKRYVQNGDPAELSVEICNNAPASFTWYEITDSGKVQVSTGTSYKINSVTDVRSFCCEAGLNGDTDTTETIVVSPVDVTVSASGGSGLQPALASSGTDASLAESVVPAGILANAVDNGKDVNVELAVSKEVDPQKIADITQQMATVAPNVNTANAQFLSIDLSYSIDNGDKVNVSWTSWPVEITIDVPASISGQDNYIVYRMHDGGVARIDCTYDPVTNRLTIINDLFSEFLLAPDVPMEYTVSWSVDGVTTTETYKEGRTPVYPGGTPYKAADAEFIYTFDGWRDTNGVYYASGSVLPEVTGDITYTAEFVSSENGFSVYGSVESFTDRNGNEGEVKVELRPAGGEGDPIQAVISDGGKSYGFSSVPAGEYVLTVSKDANHVNRDYPLSVGIGPVKLDLKLQLKGDVNGDGRISMADVSMVIAHVTEKRLLTGYRLQCADVLGGEDGGPNGEVTTADLARINSQARGYSYIW